MFWIRTKRRRHREAAQTLRARLLGIGGPMTLEEEYDARHLLAWLEDGPIKQRAERMGIDIPLDWYRVDGGREQPDGWELPQRLTTQGTAKLNALINKNRREEWKWWIDVLVPIISAITGLVGTLAALFAVLHRSN